MVVSRALCHGGSVDLVLKIFSSSIRSCVTYQALRIKSDYFQSHDIFVLFVKFSLLELGKNGR